MASHGMNHRFFTDHTYTGGSGLRELPPPPWSPILPAEFRFPYDVLEQALPAVDAPALRFFFTKEAYFLPGYGRDVVAVLLQEERCKVPVYGRQVRAVLRNLSSRPFLGYRPHLGFGQLEAVLTVEFLRDCYTSARSRLAYSHSPKSLPAPVRAQGLTISLPLGYHSQEDLEQIPMAERPLDTFFAGQVQHEYPRGSLQYYISSSKQLARKQIWAELQQLRAENRWHLALGNLAADESAKDTAAFSSYSEQMMHSRICVAPRGSVADTFRCFEGLRAGCLVVANPLPTHDAYLGPDAPVLIVDQWRELRGILDRYARDIPALEAWRMRSLAWWHDHLRPSLLGRMVAERLNFAGNTLLP